MSLEKKTTASHWTRNNRWKTPMYGVSPGKRRCQGYPLENADVRGIRWKTPYPLENADVRRILSKNADVRGMYPLERLAARVYAGVSRESRPLGVVRIYILTLAACAAS